MEKGSRVEPLLRKPMRRRAMMSVLGAGTLSAVLAACGGATASPTTAPKAAATTAPAPAAATAPAAGATKPAAAGTTAPAAGTTAPAAGATAAPAAGATKPAAQTTAPKGGTLVVGFWQEPESLHPYITSMTYSIWINQVINTEMIKTGKNDQLTPNLLAEVPTLQNGGVSQDGKTYKVTFKPNLKWSDGQPLTGDDLVFTWQQVMNPQTGISSTTGWDKIEDIELSADKLTATIRLKQVHVSFIQDVLTYAASAGAGFLMPKHYWESIPPERVKEDPFGAPGGGKYVGAGPFKIVEWQKGQSLTVERNPNWHGDAANLDKIIYSFVASREAEIDGLRTGDLDYAVDFIESQVPDLQKLPESQVFVSKAVASIERYYFNMWEPGPDNRMQTPHRIWGGEDGANVRKAMAMAMNRKAVVDSILFGNATVAVNEMDNLQWFNKNLQPYPYDTAKAEEMLDAAGWRKGADGIREKNGVKFEFTHATTSGNVTREAIQRAFIADLEKVGIRMKIQNHPPAEMFANYANGGVGATGKYDMWGWTTGSIDPTLFLQLYHSGEIPTKDKTTGSNYMGYKSARMDDLTAKQAQAIDPAERKKLVDEIQQVLYDDCPCLYIYDRSNIDVAKNYVVGVEPYPAARYWWNVNAWGTTRKS